MKRYTWKITVKFYNDDDTFTKTFNVSAIGEFESQAYNKLALPANADIEDAELISEVEI